jgi:hypothetical protein
MVRRASFAFCVLTACASHPEHHGKHGEHPDFPACAVLAKTCHAHDKDSEEAHACHVLGHSAPSNDECESKRTDCMAICGGADAGSRPLAN